MRSFAAVSGDHPHTLILGSMPGTRSLEEKAYYAHPRNAFWPILLAWLTGRTAHYELADDFPYEKRLSLLTSAGFALWDVLADCERRGSLDTAIVRHSSRANPIAAFVQQHPMLRQVLFNGRAAHDLWQRHIQPDCQRLAAETGHRLHLLTLPSTSPAMARLDLAGKAALWHPALSRGASDCSDVPSSCDSDR